MTIILPTLHRSTGYTLRPIRAGKPSRSATGAVGQPASRTGDHWAMEVSPGTLSPLCARRLLADILCGPNEPIRVPVPQRGIDVGSPGTPRVSGPDQVGDTLVIDGLPSGFTIRKGWFFNVLMDEGPSLHLVAQDVVASAGGGAAISFWPDLRNIPADDTPLEFSQPFIQGLLDAGGDHATALTEAILVDGFVVEEDH